jgi:hypothetical protein
MMLRSSRASRGRNLWIAGTLLSVAILLGGGEGVSRIFWRTSYGVSPRDARHVLFAFYPELRRIGNRPSRQDGVYNILLLGGSVLNRSWGAVEQALIEQFALHGRRDVRVLNLSMPGQTSRDSLLKYAALSYARFNLVVLYDGINDVRMSNAPPDMFREDYSHYSRYEIVNALAPYHGTARFALPYTIRYLSIRLRQALRRSRYLPDGPLGDKWTVYGRQARSVAAFEHNLTQILKLAAQRGDPVMLMTCATYVPAGYSLDAFRRRALDYDLYMTPIELWGRLDDVVTAVARQNEAVRKLAAHNPTVLFVDQARLMSPGAVYFNDVCHLTLVGSSAFASAIVQVVAPTPPEYLKNASNILKDQKHRRNASPGVTIALPGSFGSQRPPRASH